MYLVPAYQLFLFYRALRYKVIVGLLYFLELVACFLVDDDEILVKVLSPKKKTKKKR